MSDFAERVEIPGPPPEEGHQSPGPKEEKEKIKKSPIPVPIKGETNPTPTHCIICALPNPPRVSEDKEILQFFLKKLLKYQLLSNSQLLTLSLNENYIHFCTECDEQLTSSFSLHLDILELESKLDQLRSTIEDKILATLNSDGFDFWCQQVRRRVREESSTITPESIKAERDDSSFEPFDFLALEQEQIAEGSEEQEPDKDKDQEDDTQSIDNGDDVEEEEEDDDDIAIIEVTPGESRKRKMVQRSRRSRGRPRKDEIESKKSAVIVCPICPMKFDTGTALSTHIARNHKSKFTCLVCKMTFSRRDYFLVHTSCHSDYPTTGITGNYEDPGYSVEVDDPIELSSDSEASSGDSESDSDFSPPKRDTHRKRQRTRTKTPKLKKPSMHLSISKNCPLCSLVFDSYPKMITHLNKEHDTIPSFACDAESCERKFLREDFLASHRRLEHGDTSTTPDVFTDFTQEKLSQRTCPVCWKVFERPSMMTSHHSAVHLDLEKNFICEICAKQFKRQDTLKKHLEFHSTGEEGKIFKCDHDQCDKSFRRKRDMEVHQRLHTGVKGLLCSLCGQSFRHEWSFRRHNILLHGLRPSKTYDCTACGKVFKIKWHLDQHLKSKSHGGSGLGKRIRRRKPEPESSGGDVRTEKVIKTRNSVLVKRGEKEQEQPIDLVFDQRNNDGSDPMPVSVVVRPSQQRFVNNFEILPPQQSQHFAGAHSSSGWWPQPGFNPTQQQQFF